MKKHIEIDTMKQLEINKKAIKDAEKTLAKIDKLSSRTKINYSNSMMFLQKLNPSETMLKQSFQEINKMQNSEGHDVNLTRKKSLFNNIATKKTI